MKCVKCGTELAADAKFCGECGTRVERGVFCPECGAKVAPSAKFCGECGHKIVVEELTKVTTPEENPTTNDDEYTGEEPTGSIDWNGAVHLSDLQYQLDDGEVYDVKDALGELGKKAKSGRVLTVDDDGFSKKLANFCNLFAERTGAEHTKSLITENAIGIIDWSEKGNAHRAVLISRIGVFYISGDYPKMIDGEAVGGLIFWKLLYKFATCEGNYWKVSFSEILESDEVDDEVKGELENPDPKLVMKAYLYGKNNYSGLDADSTLEFLDTLRDILDGDYMIEEE